MANVRTIRNQLALLAVVYPTSRRSEEELLVLARVWAEDMARLTDPELEDAVRRVRRTARFFPTPAEVLDAHQEALAERPRPQAPSLPRPTPEDAAHALQNIRRIQEMLRGIPCR